MDRGLRIGQVRVGYSRISDERQAKTDPLKQAERDLLKAGAELVLVEVGSGKDDNARPKFRQLRELVLDGKVTEIICPNQDRLGRNLDLVMQFVQLCQMQGVRIVDLNGRQLEVKTADGRLMTQIIGALDEHRSRLYGEKTRRHLQSAREEGKPARPRVPFGLRKIRNDSGRFVGVELDPETAPLARQRVDWFLSWRFTHQHLHPRQRGAGAVFADATACALACQSNAHRTALLEQEQAGCFSAG